MINKQTKEAILEWVNAEDVEGEFIDTVRLRRSSFEDFINSLPEIDDNQIALWEIWEYIATGVICTDEIGKLLDWLDNRKNE